MKVVNLRHDPFDLYIGRENKTYGLKESKWHNPFRLADHPLEDVLSLYESHVRQSSLYDDLHELEGLTLGCWCSSPDKCHGGILMRLFNEKRLNDMFVS